MTAFGVEVVGVMMLLVSYKKTVLDYILTIAIESTRDVP